MRKGLDFSAIVRIKGLFEERGRDKSHWHSADPTMVVTRVKEGLEREREMKKEHRRGRRSMEIRG